MRILGVPSPGFDEAYVLQARGLVRICDPQRENLMEFQFQLDVFRMEMQFDAFWENSYFRFPDSCPAKASVAKS